MTAHLVVDEVAPLLRAGTTACWPPVIMDQASGSRSSCWISSSSPGRGAVAPGRAGAGE
ncbi:hypothetical protein ABZY09_27915 [Streptomyces sp. NPDC002928]|uniref:hypothetical protein n=1 Tax=Streptomyces sp. NPDC002928 TaxID=3154440 RepID=UPI0033A8E22E